MGYINCIPSNYFPQKKDFFGNKNHYPTKKPMLLAMALMTLNVIFIKIPA